MSAIDKENPNPICGSQRLLARSTAAFSLMEIGVVVLIIGLLASIAVPQIKKTLIAARSEALINDLRVFAQSFQHYQQEKGDWPPEEPTPGVLPQGMAGYIGEGGWKKKTPIGGYYNWERQIQHSGLKIQAAIAVSSMGLDSVASDRMQLEDIDRRMDDGDLSTGNFRLGFRNEPILIIEP